MSASKVQKKLPKRVTNEKSKSRRARSWAQNQIFKNNMKTDQARREQINANRGFTGKQLDNAIRRNAKLHNLNYRVLRKENTNESFRLSIASEMGLI